MKQSVGYEGAEFLRMAIQQQHARGYVSRSISSLVVGNWTSETIAAPRELLSSVIGTTRSIINRGERLAVADLLAYALQKRCGRIVSKQLMRSLLRGELALGDGPTYASNTAVLQSVVITTEVKELEDLVSKRAIRTLATHSYLSKHVSPVERYCLEKTGGSVRKAMVRASFAKSVLAGTTLGRLDVKNKVTRRNVVAIGCISSSELLHRTTRRGVLCRYPLLNLLKEYLSKREVLDLLSFVGRNCNSAEWYDVAWGGTEAGSIIQGVLPYSDASALCKVTRAGIIRVTYDIMM